MPYFILNL